MAYGKNWTGLSLVNEINEVFCDNFIAVTVSSSSNAVYKMKMIIYIQMCPVNALSLNKLLICMNALLTFYSSCKNLVNMCN